MRSLLYVLWVNLTLAYKIYWINRRSVSKLIKELRQQGYILTEKQTQRITFYTIQSCLTNSWFSSLRGYKPSSREIQCALYLGAITPLIDDLTDSLKITSSEIIRNVYSSDNDLHESIPMVRYLYFQMQNYGNPNFLRQSFQALIEQDNSISQIQDETLKNKELKRITRAKGGSSVLLYRLVLNNSLKKGEEKALMKLGYSLQLLNDMFDVYKDYTNKQQTLFTNTIDLQDNIDDFNLSVTLMTRDFFALDYEPSNIKRCLCEISVILSRGQYCLAQLFLNQLKTNGAFYISEYSRKDLVCDMEKVSTFFRLIQYSVRFYSKIR